MAVDTHGLEVLKKAGEEVTPGDPSDLYIKVKDISAGESLVTIATLQTAANLLLTTIRDNADQLEGYTDGLEGLITSTNNLITSSNAYLDTINQNTDNLETLITTVNSNIDTVESLLGSINTNTDTLESLVTLLNGYVDGLETSLASLDGKLGTLGQKNMAGSAPVVIASDQNSIVDLTNSGTLANNITDTVQISTDGRTVVAAMFSGTWTGTVQFQATVDENVRWDAIVGVANGPSSGTIGTTTTNQTVRFNVSGYKFFRVIKTVAGSGTVVVNLRAADDPGFIQIYTTALSVAAAQTGTWTVQPGNTANTTPWLVSAQGSTGTLTNRSGTATSTTAQVMAANSTRKYIFFQNPNTSGNFWINFTTTAVAASPSIKLAPGDVFVMEGNFVSTEAINIIREGGSDLAYTAKEG